MNEPGMGALGQQAMVDGGAALMVTITVGVDGRIYFHDLLPELLTIAAEICPRDPALLDRLALQPRAAASMPPTHADIRRSATP